MLRSRQALIAAGVLDKHVDACVSAVVQRCASGSPAGQEDGGQPSSSVGIGYVGRFFNRFPGYSLIWKIDSKQVPMKKKRVIRGGSRSAEVLEERMSLAVKQVKSARSSSIKLLKTEDLNQLLMRHPQLRSTALEKGVVKTLKQYERWSPDEALRGKARQSLALLGVTSPLPAPGIRILSIDGGGTRGMMSLEILAALEKEAGKRIHELFDFVVGCSTGAIIGALLAGLRLPVSQCTKIYKEMSKRLFAQNRVFGVSGLVWAHSYYDSKEWCKILQEAIGQQSLMDTVKLPQSPKLCIVSCVVNQPVLNAFTFRNYEHPVDRESVFPGSVKHRLWEALQASAAAPGYFEEVKLDEWLHQDGGVLVNNPTGVGVHEARLLWPGAPLHCVVSIGNGRSLLSVSKEPSEIVSSSLKEKLIKIVDSATDTEITHTMMHDLLPGERYFRLNPYISHPYTLDEIDPSKIQQMEQDAQLYVRKNIRKIRRAATRLCQRRPIWQQLCNWLTQTDK